MILAFIFITPAIYADNKNQDRSSEVKTLMLKYLSSIKNKDLKGLKSTITSNYYETLDADGGIKKLFSMQSEDNKPIKFDVKVIKQKVGYRANIKDKSEKGYDDYWYQVTEVGSTLLIDGTIHLEEN